MDTAGQFQRFLTCVAVGFLGGILYELISLLDIPCKAKVRVWLRLTADVAFFALFAVVCVWSATKLRFPSFRGYYYFGYAIGLILYLKTFHKAVAFFKKICYNGIKRLLNCVKSKKIFRKKGEKRL
jgi:hypothetical protein